MYCLRLVLVGQEFHLVGLVMEVVVLMDEKDVAVLAAAVLVVAVRDRLGIEINPDTGVKLVARRTVAAEIKTMF